MRLVRDTSEILEGALGKKSWKKELEKGTGRCAVQIV
jgi:hypothetical protein